MANHCEKTQNDQNESQIDQQGAQMTRKRWKNNFEGMTTGCRKMPNIYKSIKQILSDVQWQSKEAKSPLRDAKWM